MWQEGRGASAPSSGYVPTKLLNYSIKVASPASAPSTLVASSSPPGPSAGGARVPSSPVGTLTTLPGQGHGQGNDQNTDRTRTAPPNRNHSGCTAASGAGPSPNHNSPGPGTTGTRAGAGVSVPPGPLLQPLASMAVPLTSHHIQLPMSAQVRAQLDLFCVYCV